MLSCGCSTATEDSVGRYQRSPLMNSVELPQILNRRKKLKSACPRLEIHTLWQKIKRSKIDLAPFHHLDNWHDIPAIISRVQIEPMDTLNLKQVTDIREDLWRWRECCGCKEERSMGHNIGPQFIDIIAWNDVR
jgi:hypothetical protein